jgi:signal transduction histidine kinase
MTALEGQPFEVFYSYAHEDEALRSELEKHLHTLELEGLISGWHDRNIGAGTEWTHEVDFHLNRAKIILLLISPDFLNSRYCYSIEMIRAMERHHADEACVIPIILRPIYWQGTPFSTLQILPTDAQPVTRWANLDEAFLNVTVGIRKVIKRLAVRRSTNVVSDGKETFPQHTEQRWYQQASSYPYRGLSAFREQDAPFFFGRDVFAEQLFERVRKKPFVAVLGSSGSGKSSLVFAGLLPRLRYEGNWQISTFRPGERPFHALASTLIPMLEPQLDEVDRLLRTNKLAEPLRRGEILLWDVIKQIIYRQNSRFLLFVDQFEEIYTLCHDKEVYQRFLDCLVETIRLASQSYKPSFVLVITLRADFLNQALLYRPFADELQSTDLKISPMNQQELQDAIVRPAKLLSVDFEQGLTQLLLKEVHQESGNLPLLEFTLASLWAKQQDAKLTHQAYLEIGGVEEGLAVYAEEVFGQLSKQEQQQAREVFVQLVHSGEETGDTRRIASRSQVGEKNWNLVNQLADARLVVSSRDETTAEEVVEIIHETLIRAWSRLREWMVEDRGFRQWQDRLRARIKDGDFLREQSLREAEKWLIKRNKELALEERKFIEDSREQIKQENKLYQRYLADLTHDLRTPLHSIIAYGSFILDGFDDGKLTTEQEEHIQFMVNRAEGLSHLVDDMFDLARIEAGHIEVKIEEIELYDCLMEVINQFKPLANKKDLYLELEIEKELKTVHADSYRLCQIAINLVSNALKFTEKGGVAIRCTLANSKKMAHIAVSDSGIGISPSALAYIFEAFRQADGSTTRRFGGTGLGLTIAKKLVELQGGEISVESVVGQGSTFSFSLPVAFS